MCIFRSAAPKAEIVVTLPDGSEKSGLSNETTPYDIAVGISKGLAGSVVVAKVFCLHCCHRGETPSAFRLRMRMRASDQRKLLLPMKKKKKR